MKKPDVKKSKRMPIMSFIFGLIFWIPLLNLIFGVVAIYLGVKSLINIKKDPSHFGGKWFAIAGIVLGSIVYVTYLAGLTLCLSGSKEICGNIGLGFFV